MAGGIAHSRSPKIVPKYLKDGRLARNIAILDDCRDVIVNEIAPYCVNITSHSYGSDRTVTETISSPARVMMRVSSAAALPAPIVRIFALAIAARVMIHIEVVFFEAVYDFGSRPGLAAAAVAHIQP